MQFKNIKNNQSISARRSIKPLWNSLMISTLLFIHHPSRLQAQEAVYAKPSWYFGIAGGANFNFFRGSTQELNAGLITPSPFHDGSGVGLYVAPLIEFRPANSVLGIMLQSGYDSRMGKFKQIKTPCNCPADLSTHLSYFVIEPSLRIAPFKNGFYLYLGPRMAFNLNKEFTYQQGINPLNPTQIPTPEVKGDFSQINKTQISAQAGMGYDIRMTALDSRTQVLLSPFVAFQPYYGQTPRAIETWNITTVRGGLSLKIGRGRKASSPRSEAPLSVVQDRDGDGVADAYDQCPDQKGLASLQGCPDKDGDGIADAYDRCPDERGLVSLQGCPDSDVDGIANVDDQCPNVFGLSRYQGCPIPDTDGDGINDEEDHCVTKKGPASNSGCPIISDEIKHAVNMDAKDIYFVTASSELLPKSLISLNDVAEKLNENRDLKVQIDGHTDFVGSDDYNHQLSHERADAVKTYLISKGIDEARMTTKGYGEGLPIADNQTSVGRSKNRRVEMTLSIY